MEAGEQRNDLFPVDLPVPDAVGERDVVFHRIPPEDRFLKAIADFFPQSDRVFLKHILSMEEDFSFRRADQMAAQP